MENPDHSVRIEVPAGASSGARVASFDEYKRLYEKSVKDPQGFWSDHANKALEWFHPFNKTLEGSLSEGNVRWFVGGKLNACYNALDTKVANGNGDKVAIIWETDEPGNSRKFTFSEVLAETCRVANALTAYGVKKGDAVTIYLPMIPQIVFVMLACARIGAPHSVVFAGFSAEALASRIVDVKSKFVVTCDEGLRGGRIIPLKKIADEALAHKDCSFVETVFVFSRSDKPLESLGDKQVDMGLEVIKQKPYCPCEWMDSEDILFMLYTSGSTGKPKGIQHTTAGYLTYATNTFSYIFDHRPDDVYACVADCGWITGHSYIVYGPLIAGSTTVLFESTPLYPDHGRYWDLIDTHKITQLYTAPTAIRALMRQGTDIFEKYDLSSLRILGTVGEPINPEAWKWYFKNVGKEKCPIVDTYWQTETGGFLFTPFPGATVMKPGSCTLPFFGIVPVILNPQTGHEVVSKEGEEIEGVLCIKEPWPGITRSVHGNHERYLNTYLTPYPGFYFTGDGCTKDKDGYFWITGRVDDVLNVSGHRIGSAEVESALVAFDAVAEAAVVGISHEVKGEAIAAYVILKAKYEDVMNGTNPEKEADLIQSLKQQVRKLIGPFAQPDRIIFTSGLPKTRSGKIMRRLLRKILQGGDLGDVSTLADASVVEALRVKLQT